MSYRNQSTLETVEAYQMSEDDLANSNLPAWVNALLQDGTIEYKYNMFFYEHEDGGEVALAFNEWLIKDASNIIKHTGDVEFKETYQEV